MDNEEQDWALLAQESMNDVWDNEEDECWNVYLIDNKDED